MAIKKKNKEIKPTSTSNIGYQGRISIKVARDNKILNNYSVKNSGTINLFRGLAYYLGKYSSNYSDVPQYLAYNTTLDTSVTASSTRLNFSYNNGDDDYVGSKRSRLHHNTKVKPISLSGSGTDAYEITYTGQITNNTARNLKIYQLALYGDDKGTDTLLAFLNIKDSIEEISQGSVGDFIELKPNLTLIVEWTMTIQNAVSEESNL